MSHTGGDRNEVSDNGNKSAKKSIVIRIFIKEFLSMVIRGFFYKKIFPVFFHKEITDIVSDEIIDGCTNEYSQESDSNPEYRIHRPSCALHTNRDHRDLRWYGENGSFQYHHHKNRPIVDGIEEMEDGVGELGEHGKSIKY